MPFKFNPFSGNFDQTGSGGGGASYIDGEVAAYNDLPLDGTAALNSAWLVRTASGIWPVTRKQAGIYIRTATAGSSRDADYTYAGTMPDVFSDANFVLYDNGDSTKNLQFQLSGISTGTTRTLTVPNASGTLGWLQSVSSITVSTDHQLTAARNQRVRVNSTASGSGASVYLPAANNAEGDRLEVACVGLTAGTLSVRTGQYDYTVSTSMGLNEQRTFIYTAGAWTVGTVESHTHAGLGPTFASSAFQVTEPSGITTNRLAFSLSGLTAGSTRTLTVPNASGTIALTSDIPAAFDPASPGTIGATTPAAATFTNLSANTRVNLPNTNGTTAGDIYRNANTLRYRDSTNAERLLLNATDNLSNLANAATARTNIGLGSADSVTFGSLQNTPIGSTTPAAGSFSTLNVTGTTELVNGGTTAGPFRLYNISSAANANFERLSLRWASSVAIIGTEKLGTGSARALEFQTDGVTRMTIAATSNTITLPSNATIDAAGAFQYLNLNTTGDAIRLGSKILFFTGDQTMVSNAWLGWSESTSFSTAPTVQTALRREATGVLAQRTGNQSTGLPQTYRIYGDWSSSGTNFERLAISAQASASFFIDTQKGGSGQARALELRTDSVTRLTLGSAGGLTVADANNIAVGTTTGTKIGAATDQKIGFWNATPAIQPAAVADATDAASTQARLNDLLARLRTIGIIAT